MYYHYYLQVNWHDFAFFDPVMYESLRQLIRHSQAGEAEAVFAAMDLAFAIDLCKEEGAGQVNRAQKEENIQQILKWDPNIVIHERMCLTETTRLYSTLFSLWLTQVELLSGGVNMPVTPLNVYEYVRKYAEHRMLVVAEQPLHVSTLHCQVFNEILLLVVFF